MGSADDRDVAAVRVGRRIERLLRAMVGAGLRAATLAVAMTAIAATAQAKSPVVRYPSHAAFTVTPNGGGYEGLGQTVSGTITSPKAACRQNRSFKLDVRSPTGYLTETHTYRTDATGTWTLDIVASPGPGKLVITVPAKRLDGTHRCKATGTVVPV